ncbi:shikimate dehydrogenase [Flavobacteriaceae bacterium]|jgi:shikimate dehydrogenase|nr:shikimate dehydrogenase [Flavobacteriaceae bacterium]
MKDQKENKIYGLIGKNINYSFSKNFFNNKFENEKINAVYINFDIKKIEEFKTIVTENNISGLNITIPYKESIINQLDYVDPTAKEIGAVNTIKFHNNILSGYNTDYLGFYTSIKNIVNSNTKALILGTGGASKAIAYTLKILKIKYLFVSRSKKNKNYINYNEISKEIINKHNLIINCTPLGTFPEINQIPQIPISLITNRHIVYDLIYNPSKSLLLKKSEENGATIINGYQMLENQAMESWKIWNSKH